uniref:Ribosomal protein S18 n=1 Tax=Rhodochaete parvula TaxID=110510 RepID=A0A1X9PV18_9RHOD|nr:30S ribosomal protein S18 [Rhodochaete parvula]ASK39557.1 ribosomal protein S18 [Rhodochaete parvula]
MNNYRKYLPSFNVDDTIAYTDIELLKKFVTDQGKILPRRVTGLTTKQQKKIVKAIKKARVLAYLPFVNRDVVKIN